MELTYWELWSLTSWSYLAHKKKKKKKNFLLFIHTQMVNFLFWFLWLVCHQEWTDKQQDDDSNLNWVPFACQSVCIIFKWLWIISYISRDDNFANSYQFSRLFTNCKRKTAVSSATYHKMSCYLSCLEISIISWMQINNFCTYW